MIKLEITTTQAIQLIGKPSDNRDKVGDARSILRFLYKYVSGDTINELIKLMELWKDMPMEDYSGFESFLEWVDNKD